LCVFDSKNPVLLLLTLIQIRDTSALPLQHWIHPAAVNPAPCTLHPAPYHRTACAPGAALKVPVAAQSTVHPPSILGLTQPQTLNPTPSIHLGVVTKPATAPSSYSSIHFRHAAHTRTHSHPSRHAPHPSRHPRHSSTRHPWPHTKASQPLTLSTNHCHSSTHELLMLTNYWAQWPGFTIFTITE